MTTLRFMLTAAVAALAVAAPTAQAAPTQAPAGVEVCNQATPHSLGGDLVATDGDTGPAARYQEELHAHPGRGAGLYHASQQSPALSACGEDRDSGPWDPNSNYDS